MHLGYRLQQQKKKNIFAKECNHRTIGASKKQMENEREIIERILRGESERYAYFVDKYSNALFSLVMQMSDCREEAEELTQDIFLKAFEKLSSFNSGSKFSTWLYRIAYNTTVSAMRKKQAHRNVAIAEERLADIDESAIDELLDSEEENMLARLDKAIEQLTTEERALITLYYIEERGIGETAQITGLTESNVKVRLHRIRKKLYVLIMEDI